MPRHVHKLAKTKPAKAIVQGIQAAREAKMEARRELLEQQEVLKLHSQQAHLPEKKTLSKDDEAPNLAALDKDKTIKFNRNEAMKPEEEKKPLLEENEPVEEPEEEEEAEIEEPEPQKPIHTAFKGVAPFLPIWEDSIKEMFAMQIQMTEIVTHSWLKMVTCQWYPPSPMND